jgi:hypothetical protein
MKKLLTIMITLVVISSCSTTKEAKSTRAELRKDKHLADQVLVKNAVESRRFLIKFERIYFNYGGMIELIPKANYLIVDRDKAILNTAYIGRQYDIKAIAAIDIRGKALEYAVTDNLSKGSYEIKMKVKNNGSSSFDVFIRIGKDGKCTTSVSSLKIDYVTYDGYLIPLKEQSNTPPQEVNPI